MPTWDMLSNLSTSQHPVFSGLMVSSIHCIIHLYPVNKTQDIKSDWTSLLDLKWPDVSEQQSRQELDQSLLSILSSRGNTGAFSDWLKPTSESFLFTSSLLSAFLQVCKRMDMICQRVLNQGFLKVERYHSLCQRQVKAQLPRLVSSHSTYTTHCNLRKLMQRQKQATNSENMLNWVTHKTRALLIFDFSSELIHVSVV